MTILELRGAIYKLVGEYPTIYLYWTSCNNLQYCKETLDPIQ